MDDMVSTGSTHDGGGSTHDGGGSTHDGGGSTHDGGGSTPREGSTDDARSRWQTRYDRSRVRQANFTTLSGMTVEPAYGTQTSEWPGEFPFTRGLYPTGYRG